MRLTTRLALAIIALAPATLSAQVEGILPKTTHLTASTRAMALGDSYQTSTAHADALFYHPALLTGASGFGVEVQRWGPESSSAAVSGAMQWLGGGIGVGLRTLQYSAFGSNVSAAPPGQDHLFEFGSVPVSERVATVGYAREAVFDIDLGVAVDFVDERLLTTRQSVILFDVSAARDVGPVVVGITVHDIGGKPILDDAAKPSRVTLGAGNYGHQLGIFDIGYAANLGFDDDDVTFGGGLEVGYWPIQGRTFVARVGFQSLPDDSDAAPFTTGFAFWGDNITLEWAFRPFSDAPQRGSHRFALRWR